MGIPCAITLIRRNRWVENCLLRDCKLIVDTTESMYWFVKFNLFRNRHEPMDRFGFNLVEYGRFIREFFETLREARVSPIIVYSGARPSEQVYGRYASKAAFFEKSSRIRMYKLNRYGQRLDDNIIPSVATNVLKQIINEFNFDTQPVQSVYETYPMLVKLANEHNCPVFTAHSDFIFANSRRGFILAGEFSFSSDSNHNRRSVSNGIPVALHMHSLMLRQYNLQGFSPALSTLLTLLRGDFSGVHFNAVSNLLNLPASLRLRADPIQFVEGRRPTNRRQDIRNSIARNDHILNNWPRNLTTVDAVRNTLTLVGDYEALRDFDIVHKTFCEPLDFVNDVATLMPQSVSWPPAVCQTLHEALTKRECTADFLMDILMQQTNFNRGCLEDTETYRSTYSLSDPVKSIIMQQNRIRQLKLFDRNYANIEFRNLNAPETSESGSSRHAHNQVLTVSEQEFYDLFLFPATVNTRDQLEHVVWSFQVGRALNAPYGQHLLLLLLLARFGFLIAFRDSYDNSRHKSQTRSPRSPTPGSLARNSNGNSSTGLGRVPSTNLMSPVAKKYVDLKTCYMNAIYNSFMYYAFKGQLVNMQNLQNDPTLVSGPDHDGLLPRIRLAVGEIDSFSSRNPSITDTGFREAKHLNEIMNSGLHAYYELNALANHVATTLSLEKYFNCVLIYKIFKRLREQPKKSNLLTLEPELVNLLNEV